MLSHTEATPIILQRAQIQNSSGLEYFNDDCQENDLIKITVCWSVSRGRAEW